MSSAAAQLKISHFDGGQNLDGEQLNADGLAAILNGMKAAKAGPKVNSADEALIHVAPVTALRGQRVLYDPSGGNFLITAPLDPTPGDVFAIKNVDTENSNGVTVSGNGENIEDPGSAGGQVGTTAAIAVAGNARTWQFLKTSALTGWWLI